MRLLATTPEANLGRLPIAFDLRAISLAEGLRAALSIAVIVAADQWAHWPPLLEAAVGALLTCLCDAGGPIRRRLPALLTFTLLGAAITATLGALRTQGIAVVLPVACLGIFACSLARIWGQSPLQVGNLLVVVLVLALDEPREWHDALLVASIFAAGCLWALLLTMVIWRIHPFRPARRAVSDAYRSVARLVADLRELVEAAAPAEAWEAHARSHRRAVRDTIELARTAVQDTVRVRGQASARAYQALIRVEALDQLFGALVALSDLLEASRDPAVREAAIRVLRLLRPALLVISVAIRADDPGRGRRLALDRLSRIGPAIDTMAAAGGIPALAAVTDAIVERLRVAVTLTAPSGWTPGALPDHAAGRNAAPARARPAARQSHLAVRRLPPRPAHRRGGRPGAGPHPIPAGSLPALADDHADPDHAALLRPDLAARAGADRRHRAGRRAGGGDRPAMHQPAADRRRIVPARGCRLHRPGGEFRRVHGPADPRSSCC